MAVHALSAQFQSFFSSLNPSSSSEQRASSQYGSLKTLLEQSRELTGLDPTCYLQGSYRWQTATHDINDVDIVLLLQGLSYPPSPNASPGSGWPRDRIFNAVEATICSDGRYAPKLVASKPTSMCVKLDLGIKVEILPVVHNSKIAADASEPFYLWRPTRNHWELGYAVKHREFLTYKNRTASRTTGGTDGNFIPMIKVMKHLRDQADLGAISFHIETLLYHVPDVHFLGGPADYIPSVLRAIASHPPEEWYKLNIMTPCGDRDIFTADEWGATSWWAFHEKVSVWSALANAASADRDKLTAIAFWQALLEETHFPKLGWL